jgi:soluble P-type ATPase
VDCPTGRIFNTRHKQHTQAIRNSDSTAQYSNHILNTRIGQAYGAITDTMHVMETGKKETLKQLTDISHTVYFISTDTTYTRTKPILTFTTQYSRRCTDFTTNKKDKAIPVTGSEGP